MLTKCKKLQNLLQQNWIPYISLQVHILIKNKKEKSSFSCKESIYVTFGYQRQMRIQLYSVIFISPQTITEDHDTMKTILRLFLYTSTRL